MISGLGVTEIGFIILLIILFFGPKELPGIMKHLARFWGKFLHYKSKVEAEIRDVTRSLEIEATAEEDKELLRVKSALKDLSVEEKIKRSEKLCTDILEFEKIEKASAVGLYLPAEGEVLTDHCIKILLDKNKRVALFSGNSLTKEVKCFEITDFDKDVICDLDGKRSINSLNLKPFMLSDLDIAVVPSLLCDNDGRRLGGKGDLYHKMINTFRDHITFLTPIFATQISSKKIISNYSFVHHMVIEEE